KRSDVSQWFYTSSWKRHMPAAMLERPNLSNSKCCWLLFLDDCGLGAAMVERLLPNSQSIIRVVVGETFKKLDDGLYQINPKRRDDYQAIIESLGKTDKTAINVMHMWSVTPNKRGPYEASDLETSQSRGFYSLLFLAQALGAQRINCPVTMAIVSNDMQE